MLRLSKLTDYAVAVLARLGDCQEDGHGGMDCVQTSPGIAHATGVPEPTVAKVLKALAAASLVASQRGARGGYRLTRPLETVTVADVIVAIEGPIALTACVEGGGGCCEVEHLCAMRGRWEPVNDAIRTALSRITLADLRTAAVPPAFRIPAPAAAAAEAAAE